MLIFNDYLEAARRRLPHFLFEYVNGGSYDEITLRANLAHLAATPLRQRLMKDVSGLTPEIELFGKKHALPIVLGPVGLAGMMARRGEIQAARAAVRMRIPYCMSTYSICSMSEVGSSIKVPFWYQLNMFKDRVFMGDLLKTATEFCSALIFNIDLPVLGTRYRDFKSGLIGPDFSTRLRRGAQVVARPAWSWDVGLRGLPHALGNIQPYMDSRGIKEDSSVWTKANLDPAATWRDLAWIRENWTGPLIIKGVLHPEDAQAAIDIGATAIVVSNHGGRQLDSVVSTAAALPAIAERVNGRATLFVDGGVRSGIDVLKMLTLGADAVFLGRAWINALAAAGEDGVVNLLTNMERELRVAMAMTGNRTLKEVREESRQARSDASGPKL